MNSLVCCRLALTGPEPTIKPYDQALWANLLDTGTVPPEVSLRLLEPLHTRWVAMPNGLALADSHRAFGHPELGLMRLDTNIALYAWHEKHHAARITGLRARMAWK